MPDSRSCHPTNIVTGLQRAILTNSMSARRGYFSTSWLTPPLSAVMTKLRRTVNVALNSFLRRGLSCWEAGLLCSNCSASHDCCSSSSSEQCTHNCNKCIHKEGSFSQ